MKVCLLNDSFPPVIDGVVNVVQNYAKYLTENHQVQVEVGCPRYPDADYRAYDYQVVPYQSFNTTALTSGYRTGNPFAGKAVSELARFGPDLIHTHCPASATVIARLLREETGAPVVLTYHTKYDIDIRRAVRLESVAREGIRLMIGNIEACDEVWAVSRGAGESLSSLGFTGEWRVMHNGVDFARGRVSRAEVEKAAAGYDLPENVPVFLFVGRLMTYKGLPLILDALKLLADAGQDFRMVFVGKGPDRELLEKKARELGLMGSGMNPDKCLFTGPIYDRDVLRAWNTRSDLFLFPSTFDTNGLVVREAAACGLASVLIKDSCAAEGVTDGRNGFLIEETPQAMAALLEKLCPDLPHCHQVGQTAMDELYLSWESSVAQAYERYQELLDEKERGVLPVKKRQRTDLLVSATARRMSEHDKVRQAWDHMLGDFRETAAGMMENIQETEESFGQFGEKMKNELRKDRERLEEMFHYEKTD